MSRIGNPRKEMSTWFVKFRDKQGRDWFLSDHKGLFWWTDTYDESVIQFLDERLADVMASQKEALLNSTMGNERVRCRVIRNKC